VRVGRLAATGVLTIVAGGILAGCSSAHARAASPTEVRGVSMTPELDRGSGAVTLPYDRFTLSDNQLDEIVTAQSAEKVQCARAHNLPVGSPAPTLLDAAYDSESYFGPWTTSQARRFAFVHPMSDRDLAANGIVGAPSVGPSNAKAPFEGLTESQMRVVDACHGPDSDLFVAVQTQDGPWVREMMALNDKAAAGSLPGMKPLIDTLVSCYQKQGMRAAGAEERWFPAGADGRVIDKDQISLALKVVACKDETGFTQKMADIQARAQAKIVEKYADELAQEQTVVQRALTRARAVDQKYGLEPKGD